MNPTMFTVLAEPNRLNIVEILALKPQSVNEIVSRLHLRQPQVSKHLKVLADAGIVKVNPVANKRMYELQPRKFKELDSWLQKYRTMWEERFDRLDKFLQEEKRKEVKKK
jgi:DNA-binding transcriptional ArsR family regulator